MLFISKPQHSRSNGAALAPSRLDATWLDNFINLNPQARSAQLSESGKKAWLKKAINVAIKADLPEGVVALRSALAAMSEPKYLKAVDVTKLSHKFSHRAVVQKAWRQGSYTIALQDPGVGVSLVKNRRLSAQRFFRGFKDAQAALSFATELIPTTVKYEQFLKLTGYPDAIACSWAASAAISTDLFFEKIAAPTQEHMAALFAAGRISPERWLRQGNMPADRIADLVNDGTLKPYDCIRIGWVDDSLVEKWIEEKHFEMRLYISFVSKHWQGSRALTQTMVRFACAYPAPTTLLDTLGVLRKKCEDTDSFDNFGRLLLAAHVQGPSAYIAAEVKTASTPASICSVCYNALEGDAYKPIACVHEADMCLACIAQAINSAPHKHCPYPSCTTRLTPNDILHFGMGPQAADRLAKQIFADKLAQTGQWISCQKPKCYGGIMVPSGESHTYCCVICDTQQTARNFLSDASANKEVLLELIDNLAVTGKKRECPYCGVAQTHDGGCQIMYCKAADKYWHWSEGPKRRKHDTRIRSQTYVPITGLMVKTGMYDGFRPGATNIAPDRLADKVRANARAKGLL